MDSMKTIKDLVMLYQKDEKRDYGNYKLKVWDAKNSIYRDVVIYPDGNPNGYGVIVTNMRELASATEDIRSDFEKMDLKFYAIDRYDGNDTDEK